MTRRPTLTDREWLQRAGDALRNSEMRLDGFTLSRLRAARARAVETARSRSSRLRWLLVPAAAAACLATWLLLPRPAVTPEPAVNPVAVDTLDVLTDELGPEFYDNLDLYRWLEEDTGRRA